MSEQTTKPALTPKVDNDIPEWMLKILRRQNLLNKRFELANSLFAQAYNDFLSSIQDINGEYGTDFSFDQAVKQFAGEYIDEGNIEEE